jgi:CheY-like chemotaxis protein
MLDSAGFSSAVAAGEEDGLERFQEAQFDLVICSIGMLEAISHIRQIAPQLPILAMSDGSESEDIELAQAMGVTHSIAKPFSREDLLSTIRACVVKTTSDLLS